MPTTTTELTDVQRRQLDALRALNAEMVNLDDEVARRREGINAERAALINALRDAGVGVERQAEEVGIHWSNLYRIPGVRKARRRG